jgi:hypothetical protein
MLDVKDFHIRPFNEELISMFCSHYYQYYMNISENKINPFLKDDFRNRFHHNFLKKVKQNFHKKLLNSLDDNNFDAYKFFSNSKVKIYDRFEDEYKNEIVRKIHETIFAFETIKPITEEEKEEYKYFINLASHYYEGYVHYFYELFNDYKKGFIISNSTSKIVSETIETKTQRLKTNLSVPQLALLFKILDNLKPKIFENRTEAELHRFISANFETKKSGEDGISTDKLRILFNQPEPKSIDFWEKHLHTLLDELKKIKKNN